MTDNNQSSQPVYKKYASVTDPELLKDARAALHAEYPTLTDADLDNLVGDKATELYMLGLGEDPSTNESP